MADSIMPTGMDINYRSQTYSTSSDFDAYVNRWEELEKEKALYEDKGTLSFTDMLGLMVAQFQNQSIDNQASTTDMMNQLVQMSSMQAMTEVSTQIKELTLANVMAYSASLVGQTVTVGVWNEQTKKLEEVVGVVEGAGTYNGDQVIYVGGKGYYLSDIMAVGKLPPPKDEKPGDGEDDKTDGTNTDNSTNTDNDTNTDNSTDTDNTTDTDSGTDSGAGADSGAAG